MILPKKNLAIPKQINHKKPASSLEVAFDFNWRVFTQGIEIEQPFKNELTDEPRNYRFAFDEKHEFDRAWLRPQVAVELEGNVYGKSRHTSPVGYLGDIYKYNKAAEMGWVILRYTLVEVHNNPEAMIAQVVNVIKWRMWCLENMVIKVK